MDVGEHRFTVTKLTGKAVAAALAVALTCALPPALGAAAYADDVSQGSSNVSQGSLEAAEPPAGAAEQEKEKEPVVIEKPTLANGVYVFRAKLSPSKFAIGLRKDSAASNVAVCLRKRSDSLYQRLYIRYQGDGAYSVQIANSGKYLTELKGRIVQRGHKASRKLPDTQKWKIRKSGKNVSFVNAASGKSMAVSGGKARDKAALVAAKPTAAKPTAAKSRLFRPVRVKNLLKPGIYTINSNAESLRLDVSNASWREDARAQLFAPNKSIAQKFVVRRAGKNLYRISMSISGSSLQAKGKKGKSANVRMTRRARTTKAQLWKASVGPNGIVLTNKATGGALTARQAKSGSSVRTTAYAKKATQGWRFSPTTLKVNTAANLRALLSNMPADGSRAIRLDAKGTGFTLSAGQKQRLRGALDEAWRRGESVGFVMVDLKTGITLSVGADRGNHGASTFKAAYVTYIYQSLIERGRVSYGSVAGLMGATIGQSSNEAYLALRARFGTGGFRSWLDSVGLGYLAYNPYPRLTARNLALVWSKIYAYEESGGAYVSQWRGMFNHSYYSCIREQLSGANTVYSKPGWYPKTAGLDALNDAAIVKSRNGKGSYLLAILSNTNCYGEQWIVRNVARQLDAIHAKMPRKLI